MVRSIRRFTKESERQRAARLRQMSLKESAALLESLLRSKLAFELHFSDDDHPISFAKRIELAQRRVRHR